MPDFFCPTTGISEDELDDPEQTTQLFAALARLTEQLRDVELPFGLTPDELLILGHVRARNDCTPDELTLCIPAREMSSAELTERLRRNGLLTSSRESNNGRRLTLSATQRGHEAFDSALEKYFVHVLGTLRRLDDGQRSAIEELFSEIRLNNGHA